MADIPSSFEYFQQTVPTPPSRFSAVKNLIDKIKSQVQKVTVKISHFSKREKVVRMAGMEINLTAIWRMLTSPFRLISRALGMRAKSRRSRMSEAEKQLLMVKRIRFFSILALGGTLAAIAGFFILFAWYSRDLPQPGQVVRREGFSTKILDRNGEPLYELFESENRVPVSYEQLPETLKQAVVAVEDKDFYKHQGIDLLTPFRIVYNVIFRGRVVGGSTLTQQLVKNVLLTNERTISRKFKEFVLALQIESKFSKEEILTMYLNEAPYGGTIWGVGVASESYFGKKVQDLSLTEAAILAGLPQRPTAYSPFLGKTDDEGNLLWKLRTQGVLRRMKEDGYLTDLAYEEALSNLETIQFAQDDGGMKAPHFVFYVRDLLEEKYGEDVVEKGGLTVTTSLDSKLQEEAQRIVFEEIEKIKDLNITNGSLVAMDPDSGEVLSMVGSVDYFSEEISGQFNVAVDGLRQPGSSIKPVTYLTMFKQGYTPSTTIMDVETTFTPNEQADKPYKPQNYDGKFRGPVTLRNSLGSSLNVPAVKSLAIVGIDNFLQTAYDMGFETLAPSEENFKRFGLAVTLGGAEVHLIDTVTAYSAFANGGTKVEPVAILKVQDRDGKTIFEHKSVTGTKVMTPEEAFLINDILSDNNARLLAFGANSLLNTRRPIAVKTGTTNDQRDNWTIGWSRDIIVGVWVGNNDNSAMKQVASGVTGASPIWRNTIMKALEFGYQSPDWEVPAGVEKVQIDKISGYPAHDGFEEKTDYVIKGTLPSLPDPIHQKMKLCRGENKLANEARIAAGDYDEKEFFVFKENDPVSQDDKNRWQESIDIWVNGQSDERYKYPSEYCGESGDIYVRLKQPENEKKYDSENIEIEIESSSGDGIEKIEIIANGSVKETVNDRNYKGNISLPRGRYEVWAKAYSRDGKNKESNKSKIGTGGEDWRAPDPSPIPSLSPSPSPSPEIISCGGTCNGTNKVCASGFICQTNKCVLSACASDATLCQPGLCLLLSPSPSP